MTVSAVGEHSSLRLGVHYMTGPSRLEDSRTSFFDDVGAATRADALGRLVLQRASPLEYCCVWEFTLMDQQKRLGALQRVPIFAVLSPAQLEPVAKACSWKDYDVGEAILSYQAPSTEVFLLLPAKFA